MIIYTNKGNPFGLKLLICSNFAKKEVTVKHVALNDNEIKDMKHLPILQLDSGVQLFSTDAAAKYLLQHEDDIVLRDEWLEWSTTRLAPALAHNMVVGHRADPNAKKILDALVETLDEALSKSTYLTGDKITAADVAVWSLLAPEGTLKGAQKIDNLLRWYRAITATPEVKSALEILPLKELHFTSLKESNNYGGLHHVVLIPQVGDFESHLITTDSPANIADTVSADETQLAKDSFVYVKPSEKDEPRVILPKAGEKNVLITSALPYVNNIPHLGNIIGCVLSGDIFARYSRQCGFNTLYICGTDEYGTATETKALAENLTPRQICDKYFEIHNSIYRWFGIGFDYFGRTTTSEQTEIVQQMFKDLFEAGYIETKSVDQLLCQKCDRFLADRFVEGTCPNAECGYEDARGDQCDACGKLINAIELLRPRCKICNSSPIIRASDQFFLDLPKIEPTLKKWFDETENGWTNNARVITKAWFREGLKPRCITRDLKWGIPVPFEGFENKVFYVWFDAPIGYISITNKYCKEWKQWWQPDPNANTKIDLYQFMAKDNVPFHSVMFPATLLGVNKGHTMVSHIYATEYLNYEEGKFSKSRGVGVFGNDAYDTGIPADVWRFYLASARPEGQDSSFSWGDLAARNNSELLKNFGNFVNRALVFLEKYFDSTIPSLNLIEEDYVLLALVNREYKNYINSMEKSRFRDGIRHLLSISRYGNQYMQQEEPWVLVKGSDEQKDRAGTIIGLSCNLAAILAGLIFPFMPSTARILYGQLNVKSVSISAEKSQLTVLLPTGHKIGKPVPLFTKIEITKIEELKKKYAGVQQPETPKTPIQKNKFFTSLQEAERAVNDQGAKVRRLKSSGVDKSIWQPEVNILLELKKQLTALQSPKTSVSTTPVSESTPNLSESSTSNKEVEIQQLQDEITKQGEKVRTLKCNAEKTVWLPEVEILKVLKQKLADLTGILPVGQKGKKKK
uniref:Methionine--tRNA ligase, cytoplasmic n=1 Tax=Corethrella appendiculata TaxID=1370023 RepID=U5EXD0_9DIPT